MTHQFHYQIRYLANFVVRSVTLFKRVCRNGQVARRGREARWQGHLARRGWKLARRGRILARSAFARIILEFRDIKHIVGGISIKQCIKLLLRVLFNSPPGCIRKVADKNVYLWLTVCPKHHFQLPKKKACSAGNFYVVRLLFLMGET